jgi:small subunit ribosomal protein S13
MARISGVDLPRNKRVEYALPYIFGVGLKYSRDILEKLNINFDTRVKDLSDHDIARIDKEVGTNYVTEGDLRKVITENIRRLQLIKSYRGDRHKRGLPARGQRTKTNARTRKGPRKKGGQITLKKKVSKK